MPELLVIELVAHMDAGDRRQWTADQDTRPLTELGRRQAGMICDELASQPVDALYSSAALRSRQTIEPLAERFSLPIAILPGLHETGWLPPATWRDFRLQDAIAPLGGAYAAGLGMQALQAIRASHPVGRVVACTHGDILPAVVVYLAGVNGLDLPAPHLSRGGWYTVLLEGERVDVQHHDILAGFPSD